MDTLATYAMYVMMAYLTTVWDLSFTKATAIVNVFWGSVAVSPLLLTFIVDTILGNYWMLLTSSVAYSVVSIIYLNQIFAYFFGFNLKGVVHDD